MCVDVKQKIFVSFKKEKKRKCDCFLPVSLEETVG